jgi:SAM-dependent methyltransferase
VTPFWHPLSTLLLTDPVAFATPSVLRFLARASGSVELVYAGDRMWPSARHGDRVTVRLWTGGSLARGTPVVACDRGVPELLRVDGHKAGGDVVLRGDADPGEAVRLAVREILGVAELPARSSTAAGRVRRRALVDLREALGPGAGALADPADSVQDKYENQAPMYALLDAETQIDPGLLALLRERAPSRGSILVAGSGTGRECFALARDGWTVRGVDFSAAMTERARRAAEGEGLPVEFETGDLRNHRETGGSLDAILFTPDVYSFVPGERARTALLREMRGWLRPGGVVFLSPRWVTRGYERWILTLSWIRRGVGRGRGWGASHTRYIGTDGELRRSFIQLFTFGQIRREAERAGFTVGPRRQGYVELV